MAVKAAAYCRVSTDNEDQKNSLESQKTFFHEYIEKHPSWQLVKVFADEGLSGTSTTKRVQFNSMIAQALAGEIDIIVTKEVSRFARNTVDTLSFTRKLAASNVRVIFINDNIDTFDNDAEFRLTLMSSLAQEESRKTSERVKWGITRRMERGKVSIRSCFGFNIIDGVMTVNQEEAAIVRLIFHKYVHEKKGCSLIANELNESEMLIGKRSAKWITKDVTNILSDEKYVGDIIMKKTVTPNFLDHKAIRNDGIEEKIFHSNHHEPIIDRCTWDKAREEHRKRSELVDSGSRYTNRYWCSGKLRCAECGSGVMSRNKYNKDGSVIRFWYCKLGFRTGKHRKSVSGKDLGCKSNLIGDRALIECVRYALANLKLFDKGFADELYTDIKSSFENGGIESTKPLRAKIAVIEDKKAKIIELCLDGKIDEDEMEQMNVRHRQEIAGLKKRMAEIDERNKFIENSKDNISVTLEAMKKIVSQDEPTPELYSEVVEKILLYADHKVDIYFKYFTHPICIEYKTSSRGKFYKVECTLLRQKVC